MSFMIFLYMYINEYQVAFNLITMPYLILYLCREKSLIDEMKTTSICVYIEERREKREERRDIMRLCYTWDYCL